MASLPIRDQVNDQLLTPRNAALIIIDYATGRADAFDGGQ